MKTLIFMLIFTFTFIGCGKDNSSGGSDSTSNGVDSTIRYTQMATTAEENKFMYDDYANLALQVMKNKNFYLLKQTRRGLVDILSGVWYVSGTSIVLDRMGAGSYLESTENGVIYDCLYFQSQNLTAEVKDQLSRAGVSQDTMLKFCHRR